jgi:hypothetical protein
MATAMARSRSTAALALALLALASAALPASLAVTSPYVRPPPRATLSLPRDDDADGQTPQQVRAAAHLALLSVSNKDVLRFPMALAELAET